jgi:hypothetical protein
MQEPSCSKCKTGAIHLANFYAWKHKEISMLEFAKRENDLGYKCITCKWNEIGGLKARAAKAKNEFFQKLDHFEEIE